MFSNQARLANRSDDDGVCCSEEVYQFPESQVDEVRERFGDLFWNHVAKSGEKFQHVSSECLEELRLVTKNSTDKEWSQKSIRNSKWKQIKECRCQEWNSFFKISNHSILNCFAFLFIIGMVLLVFWAGVKDARTLILGSKEDLNPGFLYYCFSPKNNLIDLFTTTDEVRWRRVDKLRLLSFQVVIIMHLGIWPLLFGPALFGNMTRLRSSWRYFLLQPMINSYYFEGLMALGGISSGIAIWQKTNKKTELMEYLKLVIKRFFSIQPVALATVFLEITVSHFFSGPGSLVFKGSPRKDCQEGILYHVTQTKSTMGKNILCASHLWSISTEFYLYTVAVFLIYLYHHDKIRAKIIMTLVSLGGFLYTISIFYISEVQPGFIVYPFKLRQAYSYITEYYMSISTHFWLFAYAILVSVLLVEKFDQQISMKWQQRFITISKALFIACAFSSSVFNVYGHMPNALVSSIYMTLLHTSLAFYLTWTIVSDANEGRKMIFSRISWKKLKFSGPGSRVTSPDVANRKPESQPPPIDWLQVSLRLSRIAYFPHAIVILGFYSNSRKPIDPLSSEQMLKYIEMYLCIFALAPVFHILITGPYSRILRWSKKSKTEILITNKEKVKIT
ncbi:uncharacterized protein LOC141853922 isoform X2 [Brevipalpus obovatus]|uniref:uncharacterized protein LOC141853922 isoform X2 n=1 Tax=Brevipalpus obovatus TaxID=246614 RepID=UPI003D9DEBF1